MWDFFCQNLLVLFPMERSWPKCPILLIYCISLHIRVAKWLHSLPFISPTRFKHSPGPVVHVHGATASQDYDSFCSRCHISSHQRPFDIPGVYIHRFLSGIYWYTPIGVIRCLLPTHTMRIRILPWFVSWMRSHSTPLTHNHITIRGNCFDVSADLFSPVPWFGAHLERLRTCSVDTVCWEASYAWLKMLGFQPKESGSRLLSKILVCHGLRD